MALEINEGKANKTALAISLAFHAAILLLFFFLLAWRAPDPPLPEYGIEINFGTDNVGSGNVQSTSPANNTPKVEDARPEPPAAKPAPVTPQPEPVVENNEPDVEPEPVVEETPPVKTTETESPVVAEKKEPVKKVETPPVKEKPVKEKEPETKPEPKPAVPEKAPSKPSVNTEALMTSKNEGGAGGKNGTNDKVSGNNNGDDQGKVGDKGSPEGKLDAKALYGTPGGGSGGSALSMRGWTWDSKPNVKDESAESGRIVFQVKIDDEGRIISVVPIEKTVSPAVVAIYKREVEKLTFSPTSENSIPAPTSTGTITFILKSN